MRSWQTWSGFAALVVTLLSGGVDLISEAKPSSDAKTSKSTVSDICNHKIVDLTQTLAPGIPNFHAGEAIQVKQLTTIKENGYANRSFSTLEHCGTHIDAPSHFSEGGQPIDQISAQKLILPCVVIDVRDEVKKDPDYMVTLDKVKAAEKGGKIPSGAAILLLTGWEDRWGNPSAYRNADSKDQVHWPGFSKESAEFLINERHVKCLGIDTLSLDPGNSKTYPVHTLTLSRGLFLIENLCNLDQLPAHGAVIFCGPLRLKDGTGSPARILAIVP